MAYTQADLDALQKAIAKGAKSVQMDGERVDFRSLSEMQGLESKLKAELGQTTKPSRRMHNPNTSTGWR